MMKAHLWLLAMVVAGVAAAAELVSNPGFEALTDQKTVAEWPSFFVREKGKGRLEASGERHSGERGLRIVYEGEQDWALSNSRKTAVKPGESFKITCWMKRNGAAKSGVIQVVGLKGGKLVDWAIGSSLAVRGEGWTACKAYFTVPDEVDTVYIRIVGNGPSDFWVDDVQVEHAAPPEQVKGPKVKGWAEERPVEPLARGVVAFETAGGVYVGWRLLKDDPAAIAFDVFRTAGGRRVKLNSAPVAQTTDFVDTNAFDAAAAYTVEPAAGFSGAAQTVKAAGRTDGKSPYIRIPLAATNVTAQKVGIGDLDGDGVYDYVIKQPGGNVDPWIKYWYKSKETFKLEARRSDGALLWMKDLGWNIESGVWYSPMVVCDLNGDGRAEVAVKVGPEEDLRDAEGMAQKGPEWVGVFDGLTGHEIARVPWLPREPFESYNLASRNQLAVAYLDGKTPCLLVLRGTYGLMLAEAWQLKAGKLERLWSFTNEDFPSNFQGQGAHNCICADVDGDGRDEVILGSLALDDDGSVLWTTGKGHPDAHYYGDIDPLRPGMELAYIIERGQRKEGGVHLLDPATGKFIWQLQATTRHVHGSGMCTDIDPLQPGLEIYGADADGHILTSNRWLFASNGTLLDSGTNVNFNFGVQSAWWDADLQRELMRGRMADYAGGTVSEKIEGSLVLVADVIGDWREEVLTSVAGELRIYTTPVPAMDRRVCLMQDGPYRMRTLMNAMGYTQVPTLSYVPEALAPNVNLTVMKKGKKNVCRVVVTAPLGSGVKGKLTLSAPQGLKLDRASFTADLKPGARMAEHVFFEGKAERGEVIRAALSLADGTVLRGGVPLGL